MARPSDPALDALTLDELRLALAPAIASAASFDGWSEEAVASAAAEKGVDPAAAYAFRGGAMDMIAAWIAEIDAQMRTALSAEALAAMPVRARIRSLVAQRLSSLAGQEEALRRALSVMASPRHAGRALKLGFASADAMWRLAGDTATDYNHYTKRLILSGVYAATLAVFVDDQSEGKADTLAFLDRRIDGIIRFEKTKERIIRPQAEHFSMARLLGRLRYPAA